MTSTRFASAAAARSPGRRAGVPSYRRLRACAASLALALAGACAAPKQAWRAPTPQVLVEILPSDAVLTVDGVPLRPGGLPVDVPDAEHVYEFRAEAPGFLAATASGAGKALAGSELGLVLRPQGYGLARPLAFDDGAGLAAAAELLDHRGQHRAAREYAARAVDVAPEVPLAHRALADAAYALGDGTLAAREYSEYLARSPEARDRARVAERVAALRGDMTIPGGGP